MGQELCKKKSQETSRIFVPTAETPEGWSAKFQIHSVRLIQEKDEEIEKKS